MVATPETRRDPFAPVPAEIEAQVQQIVKRPYRKIIRGDATDGFLIEVPDLPGCMTAGKTIEEAVANLPEAMAAWLESALLDGDPIPEPAPEPGCSGQLRVRMPKSLHRQLAGQAEAEGVSLNQLIVAYLAQGVGRASAPARP